MTKRFYTTLFLACIAPSVFATQLTSQAVQITVRAKAIEGNPSLWLLIKNLDTGAVTPYTISIYSPNIYRLIDVHANQYRIESLMLQYQGGSIAPCALPASIMDNKATRIFISGDIGPSFAPPLCQVQTLNAIPNADARNATSHTQTTTLQSSAPKNPYAPVAEYLTSLKTCQKSTFKTTIEKQAITYSINGQGNNQSCKVTITVPGASKKPIQCTFNQADIAILASDKQIAMYKSGKVDVSHDSDSAAVLNKSCQ